MPSYRTPSGRTENMPPSRIFNANDPPVAISDSSVATYYRAWLALIWHAYDVSVDAAGVPDFVSFLRNNRLTATVANIDFTNADEDYANADFNTDAQTFAKTYVQTRYSANGAADVLHGSQWWS